MKKARGSYLFLLSLTAMVWLVLPALNLCHDLIHQETFTLLQLGELGEEESESSEKEGSDDDVKCSIWFAGRYYQQGPALNCNFEIRANKWESPYSEGLLDPPESLI